MAGKQNCRVRKVLSVFSWAKFALWWLMLVLRSKNKKKAIPFFSIAGVSQAFPVEAPVTNKIFSQIVCRYMSTLGLLYDFYLESLWGDACGTMCSVTRACLTY